MSGASFEFKQFSIFQDKTAMKVGTDGVMLGAWVELPNSGFVLDVGTGTGLIALMMAQRNIDLLIDAVEIDKEASIQARQNVNNSPWKRIIAVMNISLQEFKPKRDSKYDLVVSNPPFFSKGFKAPNNQRSIARHTDALSHETLLECSDKLLAPNGTLAVVLPYSDYEEFSEKALCKGFVEQRRLTVYPRLEKPAVRVLSQWGKENTGISDTREMIIEPFKRHQYSPEYIALTKGFYLNM